MHPMSLPPTPAVCPYFHVLGLESFWGRGFLLECLYSLLSQKKMFELDSWCWSETDLLCVLHKPLSFLVLISLISKIMGLIK